MPQQLPVSISLSIDVRPQGLSTTTDLLKMRFLSSFSWGRGSEPV